MVDKDIEELSERTQPWHGEVWAWHGWKEHNLSFESATFSFACHSSCAGNSLALISARFLFYSHKLRPIPVCDVSVPTTPTTHCIPKAGSHTKTRFTELFFFFFCQVLFKSKDLLTVKRQVKQVNAKPAVSALFQLK